MCSRNDHSYSIQPTDDHELPRFCQKCSVWDVLLHQSNVDSLVKLVWKPVRESRRRGKALEKGRANG